MRANFTKIFQLLNPLKIRVLTTDHRLFYRLESSVNDVQHGKCSLVALHIILASWAAFSLYLAR